MSYLETRSFRLPHTAAAVGNISKCVKIAVADGRGS